MTSQAKKTRTFSSHLLYHSDNRLKLPPQESRDRFKTLVVIQETVYDFELTAAFKRAISDQEAAVTVHYALPPTAPIPGAAGPS